jgi:hypothetical protein
MMTLPANTIIRLFLRGKSTIMLISFVVSSIFVSIRGFLLYRSSSTLLSARCDEGPDSHVDMIVDLVMADRTIPMDFIVLTPEQYERQKNVAGTVVCQVER